MVLSKLLRGIFCSGLMALFVLAPLAIVLASSPPPLPDQTAPPSNNSDTTPPPVPSGDNQPPPIPTPSPSSQPPRINSFQALTSGQTTVAQNQSVGLVLSASDPDSNTLSATLDYGDGQRDDFAISVCSTCGTASQVTRAHAFTRTGLLTLTLKVRDNTNEVSATTSLTVTASATPQPANNQPVIKFFRVSPNSALGAGQTAMLEYDVCDPDNDPVTLDFNWGDGQVSTGVPQTCGQGTRTHIFNQAGSFKLNLTAQDSHGAKAGAAAGINITGPGSTTDQRPPAPPQSSLLPVGATSSLNAGNLVKSSGGDGKVYQIVLVPYSNPAKYLKHWIKNPTVFQSYGFNWADVQTIDQSTLDQTPRVKLVSVTDSSAIYYLTESGFKRLMPDWQILGSYGNTMEEVVSINATELAAYPNNKLIHLQGDSKIYLLQKGQKRWVKSQKALKRLGLKIQSAAVVNQTEFDYYPTGLAIP